MQNRRTANGCSVPCAGIVHGAKQQFYDVYPMRTAIRQGTLYPELDKPMACAQKPSGCAEPGRRQSMAFAAWETRLYLDTHPMDANALQFYQQLCQQMDQPNYACTFAGCQTGGTWRWVDDPWPWEVCANEGRA